MDSNPEDRAYAEKTRVQPFAVAWDNYIHGILLQNPDSVGQFFMSASAVLPN